MKTLSVILGVIAYFSVGYAVAKWMGGDRSKLSPDVTYLDWLGILLWMLFWPLGLLLSLVAFLREAFTYLFKGN